MATPTSSSNRSKRKSPKPITQGQNPQRGNRQKVSNAQVTNSGTRGSNTGSAKVTTGRGAGAPKPADPWKSPTTKNSRTSAPTSNTTFRTQNTPLTLPNSRAQGTNLPRSGAQQLRSSTQGARPSGKPPVKPSGNYKAPRIPKPVTSAIKEGTSLGGRFASGLGFITTAGAIADKAKEVFNPKDNIATRLGDLGTSITNPEKRRQQLRPVTKDPNGLSSTGIRVSDTKNKRDYKAAPTGSPEYNNYRNQQIAAERERLKGVGNPPKRKPQAPPTPTGASSPGNSSRTSTPRPIPSTNSRPAPAANAGMKNQDKNFRGNLFEKTFGYKPGNAPDQTRARQDKAANPSNFDTKSDTYQPQTKVDGSQYADKKPDLKKVNEYDRRKRRYYD